MNTATKHTVCLSIALPLAALAVAACGSEASSSAVEWACATTDVPNGAAYQCTSTDERTLAAASALGGSYTCPGNATATTQCPPPAEDAPPPDGGSFVSTPPPGPSGQMVPPDDADVPDVGPLPGPSGSGSGGNGHGHGNGKGNGGPPDGPPTSVSLGDASSPPPGMTPPGPGGNDGGAVPPFDCSAGEGLVNCTQPPACAEGFHPSACGACVPDATTEDCTPPSSGGCWVTGGGFIEPSSGQDSFGGNAMPMKSGTIRGQWENVDHGSGMKMHGEPSYLVCRHVNEPGPGSPNGPQHNFTTNQAYFGGPARIFANNGWSDGFWFDVVVDDHGEGKGAKSGGPDLYHVTVRRLAAPNQPGAILYDAQATLSGGNIQLHPPNNGHPFTSSTLPAWVTLQP